MPDIIQSETTPGNTIKIRDMEITPFARSLSVLVPGLGGGLIWNRPHSLLVRNHDGTELVYPVVDVTRQIIWLIMGLSVFGLLIMLVFSKRKA